MALAHQSLSSRPLNDTKIPQRIQDYSVLYKKMI